MEINIGPILAALVGLSGGVFGYLLNKKDAAQEKQINDLYTKHEKDAERLQDLEVKVAADHYTKSEISEMLANLKKYLDDRFDRLESAIKK